MNTRRDLCPDPSFDSICAIFYHMTCETNDSRETGVFVVEPRNCEQSGTRDTTTATKEAKDTSSKGEKIRQNSSLSAVRVCKIQDFSFYFFMYILLYFLK